MAFNGTKQRHKINLLQMIEEVETLVQDEAWWEYNNLFPGYKKKKVELVQLYQ